MMNIIRFTFLASTIALASCGEGFLEIKQNQSEVIPRTIQDYQALLDHYQLMNGNTCHALGLVGGDELHVNDENWNSVPIPYLHQRNAYIWAEDVYGTENVPDWDYAYKRILQANIVLDGVSHLEFAAGEAEAWNNVKGSALFYRGYTFFQLAQQFCGPFDPAAAESALGIPLRLEADITVMPQRATVAATYRQVIADIRQSADLLPLFPLINERPSRVAAYGLLARIYLQMGDYGEALSWAEQCLAVRNGLLDFKSLSPGPNTFNTFEGMKQSNPEVLFLGYAPSIVLALSNYNLMMDASLMASYGRGDLRRDAYFRVNQVNDVVGFRGSYCGEGVWFTGLAIDEVLLARAECLARKGDVNGALDDLNRLLVNRHSEGFVPLQSDNPNIVLQWIISERKKELVFRGLRWGDLRRLNKEPRFAVTLSRTVNGRDYTLTPDDLRYTWPIPNEAVLRSGMEQNER